MIYPKKLTLILITILLSTMSYAQKLNSMQWLNEPKDWKIDGDNLSFNVTPQTDYWRITHYGFTVDDGPFFYSNQGGEFEVNVKIVGAYKTRFDQMGLMFRIDEQHWIKTGIEYVDGNYNFSTVTTDIHSSWNVIKLAGKTDAVWIKAVRKTDALEISYSLNGKDFIMSGLTYFPSGRVAMVGMMAASPDGDGFNARFENFDIKHLPDTQRVKWLKENQ